MDSNYETDNTIIMDIAARECFCAQRFAIGD